jgi:hypothetical protein
MAVKKATTTEDVTAPAVEDGVAPYPTREEMVKRVEEHSDPDMVAEVKERKYTKLTSPAGHVTEVPDEIVDALVDSGYTKGASAKTESK